MIASGSCALPPMGEGAFCLQRQMPGGASGIPPWRSYL